MTDKKPPQRKRKIHDVSLAPPKLRVMWAEKSHMSARQGRMKITLPSIPAPRSSDT